MDIDLNFTGKTVVLLEKAKRLAVDGEKVSFLIATQDKFVDLKPEMIKQFASNKAIESKRKFKDEYAKQSTAEIAQKIIRDYMEYDRARSKTKLKDASEHFLYMDIKRQLCKEFPQISVKLVPMSKVGVRVRELMSDGHHILLDEFGTFRFWDYDPLWFTEEHVVKVSTFSDFI